MATTTRFQTTRKKTKMKMQKPQRPGRLLLQSAALKPKANHECRDPFLAVFRKLTRMKRASRKDHMVALHR